MQKDIWTGRIFMFPREYQNEKKSILTSEYDFLTIHFDTRHFIYNRKAVLHLRKLMFYIRLSRCSTDVGERKIRLVTALDQIKNLIQIKYQRLLLIWAPISELPSHIITLENAECYSFLLDICWAYFMSKKILNYTRYMQMAKTSLTRSIKIIAYNHDIRAP